MNIVGHIDFADAVAIAAVLVTILLYAASVGREARMRFLNNFGQMYKKTFALRNRLSKVIQPLCGEEFFYELDRIRHCEQLRDAVLDYLTEMENFFFLIVGHPFVKRYYETLMAFPLYQRLLAFYGFILNQRQETNNHKLFLNYEKALEITKRMKKIRSQTPDHVPKCYVGIRSSDCAGNGGYFQEDACIFSSHADSATYSVRPNQNKANKDIMGQLLKQMEQLRKKIPGLRFVFYNGAMAYNFPTWLHREFLCLNPQSLLQSLNDKLEMKRWLVECEIPVLAYETFLGQELSLDMLKRHFPGADKYVLQSSSGGGGIGTYVVSDDNFERVAPGLQALRQYLVSGYIETGVSVNTHVFISDKQTVLSPGSLQIVELEQDQLCYRGADYVAFRSLPAACREQVRELSLKLANRLRQRGYRGVAGLDFLVGKGQTVYCMEVNPRFQASSPLLDRYLAECAGPNTARSVFELNDQAFSNRMVTTLCFDDIINYSCYYYYKGDLPLNDLLAKRELLKQQNASVQDDGFLHYGDAAKLDKDSYLFQAVFPHAICGISPDMTLWLNDNIPVRQAPKDLMGLKIALLNQGIQEPSAISSLKSGVYSSVDIIYLGADGHAPATPMNCVVKSNLSQYSPFSLETDERGAYLAYYGRELGRIEVEKDLLAGFSEDDRRILYLATDRLRLKLVAGCEYKNLGQGCRFCNLPASDTRFSRDDLKAALLRLKESGLSFRHILIGGGTCLSPTVWDDIIWLCQYLKGDPYFQDKPISLMTVPPPVEKLEQFRAAGLEEVAFNIEIADDVEGKRLMPKKREQPKAAYYSVLKKAVKVFGVGSVRSALLVGIDHEDVLVQEVLTLARMGVIPCLSALRSLPGSEYAKAIHPDNAYLRRIYDRCISELEKAGGTIRHLGPKCPACRNNMLAL